MRKRNEGKSKEMSNWERQKGDKARGMGGGGEVEEGKIESEEKGREREVGERGISRGKERRKIRERTEVKQRKRREWNNRNGG